MSFFIESDTTRGLRERLQAFMDEHIYPNERQVAQEAAAQRWDSPEGWTSCPTVERLQALARAQGLWNLFLPHSERAPEGLSNFDYAPLCEIMGRVHWASAVFNCNAPDTGNMETLERYASETLKDRWLEPLLRGEIRSAFLMTEPAVASSDATNIECQIRRDGDEYVINGRKWWSSGAGSRHCKVFIVMGKTDPTAPRHAQQSMIVVPADTPGVKVLRPVPVFGYDHAPHGHMEVLLENVRVPVDHILLGEGRGFEIAQGRLGPGRIHHCMRSIGAAERALEMACHRLASRNAFGKPLDRAGRLARAHRQRALQDRAGAAADDEGRVDDGHGGQQGRAGRDRDDQGGGPQHGLRSDRHGHPGPRRRGRERRLRARVFLRRPAHPAPGRRARRGAPPGAGQAGTEAPGPAQPTRRGAGDTGLLKAWTR